MPGTIALVVLAGIATLLDGTVLSSNRPATLPGSQVAAFISQGLQASHPQSSPPQLTCPRREPDRIGLVFDCLLLRAGSAPGVVQVTETSSSGIFTYRLVPPHRPVPSPSAAS